MTDRRIQRAGAAQTFNDSSEVMIGTESASDGETGGHGSSAFCRLSKKRNKNGNGSCKMNIYEYFYVPFMIQYTGIARGKCIDLSWHTIAVNFVADALLQYFPY